MIHYVIGDATRPVPKGDRQIIVHICNDEGKWGSGFVVALSKRWPRGPEEFYRRWWRQLQSIDSESLIPGNPEDVRLPLGVSQYICTVAPCVGVINMIAQRGTDYLSGKQLVDYAALESCLNQVREYLRRCSDEPTIHMPRIGCGLGGGKWEEVEPIIQRTIGSVCDVFVYDLPKG